LLARGEIDIRRILSFVANKPERVPVTLLARICREAFMIRSRNVVSACRYASLKIIAGQVGLLEFIARLPVVHR